MGGDEDKDGNRYLGTMTMMEIYGGDGLPVEDMQTNEVNLIVKTRRTKLL